MIVDKWTHLGTLVVATCILAACGGEGGDNGSHAVTSHTQTTTAVPSTLFAGQGITLIQGQGAQTSHVSQPPNANADGEMAIFAPNGDNGFFNSSIKLLIHSVGAAKLLAHLEQFALNTQDADARQAAATFTALIHKAYTSADPLSTEVRALIDDLQTLPAFNQRNDQGALEFQLRDTPQDPSDFLLRLSTAFRLDTMPGWTVNTVSVSSMNGDEQQLPPQNNGAQLYHVVNMDLFKSAGVQSLSLQQAVDVLHLNLTKTVSPSAPDTPASKLRIVRHMRTANVADLEHLSIYPMTAGGMSIHFKLSERVTLPIFDEASQKTMLLTLEPQTVQMNDNETYGVYLKGLDDDWYFHSDSNLNPSVASARGAAHVITLGVVEITSAE